MTWPAATEGGGLRIGAVLWGGSARAFAERARDLEDLGFGSLSVGDHLGHFPPLIACAAIAQATKTVKVGPLVLNNDFRHPCVLAYEAAALADLSGGRFELGLGAGYARREYERAGIPYDRGSMRVARLAESVQILRALLDGETVSFSGEHYEVRGAALRHDGGRVPILVGGNSPAVHDIAAKHGDILNLIGLGPRRDGSEDLSDFTAAALDRQLRRLGSHPRAASLELHVLVQWHEVTPDRDAAVERAAAALEVAPEVVASSPYVLIGAPDEIAGQMRDHHARFGITRWTVFADRPDLQPGEALAPVIRLLSDL